MIEKIFVLGGLQDIVLRKYTVLSMMVCLRWVCSLLWEEF